MNPKRDNLYAALNRDFHEPNRLAIMSALCAAHEGLSFGDLKESCDLTDGNLSRHLKTLEEAGAVKIRKSYKGVRPLTTVHISGLGRDSFLDYLKTLEEVLLKASEALSPEEKVASLRAVWEGQPG